MEMASESSETCTLCFNGQQLLLWCPGESLWYEASRVRIVTSRRWTWDRSRLHPSYQIGIKSLCRSSIRFMQCGANPVSLTGLNFLILTLRIACCWQWIHGTIGVCWRYKRWCRQLINWSMMSSCRAAPMWNDTVPVSCSYRSSTWGSCLGKGVLETYLNDSRQVWSKSGIWFME